MGLFNTPTQHVKSAAPSDLAVRLQLAGWWPRDVQTTYQAHLGHCHTVQTVSSNAAPALHDTCMYSALLSQHCQATAQEDQDSHSRMLRVVAVLLLAAERLLHLLQIRVQDEVKRAAGRRRRRFNKRRRRRRLLRGRRAGNCVPRRRGLCCAWRGPGALARVCVGDRVAGLPAGRHRRHGGARGRGRRCRGACWRRRLGGCCAERTGNKFSKSSHAYVYVCSCESDWQLRLRLYWLADKLSMS